MARPKLRAILFRGRTFLSRRDNYRGILSRIRDNIDFVKIINEISSVSRGIFQPGENCSNELCNRCCYELLSSWVKKEEEERKRKRKKNNIEETK